MYSKQDKNKTRQRRHERIRNKVIGTETCPRLNVFRSNANIQVQVIDDTKGTTLVACSSMDLKLANGGNVEAAKLIGAEIAKRTEQGMIACVELVYNEASGEIRFSEIDCVPTWVDKYTDGGKTVYKVIPLLDDLDANKALKTSGHKTRAKDALTAITQFLGVDYIRTTNH